MKILLHRAYSNVKKHDREYCTFDKFFEVQSIYALKEDRPLHNFGMNDGYNRYLKIEYHSWIIDMNTTYSIIAINDKKGCTSWYIDIENPQVALLFKLSFVGEI